eukprot:892128_1
MATPKKRKFVDLVSDESSDPEQESPTQPSKKFKSQPCLTITQNCNQIEQMPDLEEDSSTQQRKDENENKNYNNNTPNIIENEIILIEEDQNNEHIEKPPTIFNQRLLDLNPSPA